MCVCAAVAPSESHNQLNTPAVVGITLGIPMILLALLLLIRLQRYLLCWVHGEGGDTESKDTQSKETKRHRERAKRHREKSKRHRDLAKRQRAIEKSRKLKKTKKK